MLANAPFNSKIYLCVVPSIVYLYVKKYNDTQPQLVSFTSSAIYLAFQLDSVLMYYDYKTLTLLKLSISVQPDNGLCEEPNHANEKFKYTAFVRELLSLFMCTVRLRV
jgi:hypothetical protein